MTSPPTGPERTWMILLCQYEKRFGGSQNQLHLHMVFLRDPPWDHSSSSFTSSRMVSLYVFLDLFFHRYADDTQIYTSTNASTSPDLWFTDEYISLVLLFTFNNFYLNHL